MNGVAGLLDLGDGRVFIAFLGGVEHAVLEVVIEQTGRHSLVVTGVSFTSGAPGRTGCWQLGRGRCDAAAGR